MITQYLLDYVKEQLAQGEDPQELKARLLRNGWKTEDVEEAFSSLAGGSATPAVTGNTLSSFSLLFARAGAVFRQKAKQLIVVSALNMLPLAALSAGLASYMSSRGYGAEYAKSLRLEDLSWIIPVFAVFGIVSAILSLWANAATLSTLTTKEDHFDTASAIKSGIKKLLPLAWVGGLSALLIAGGTLLLVVPGILFGIWFSFASIILVDEDVRGMAALVKSREYIRGYAWQVAGNFLVLGLLVYVANIAISLIGALSQSSLFSSLLKLALSILSTPFSLAFTYVLFLNVKDCKGGNVEVKNAPWHYSAVAILGVVVFLALIGWGFYSLVSGIQ